MARTTPRDFGPDGRRLWRAVLEDYEPERHELVMLEQACRVADTIAALTKAVGAELVDDNGRVRAELVEIRQQRILLARLLAAMRLESGENGSISVVPQRRVGVRGVYRPRSVS